MRHAENVLSLYCVDLFIFSRLISCCGLWKKMDDTHAGQILKKIIQNDNLRDVKIVAGLDQQK